MRILFLLALVLSITSCKSGSDNDRDERDRYRDERDNPDNRDKRRDRNYDPQNNNDPNRPEPGGNDDRRTDQQPEQTTGGLNDLMLKYNKYLLNENFVGLVNFMHPGVRGGQAKDQTATELAGKFHNEVYDLVGNSADLENVSPVTDIEGAQYAVASGKASATLTVKKDAFNDKRVKSNFFNNLCDDYRKTYGDNNVYCNEDEGVMKIKMTTIHYLIKPADDNQWYVINESDEVNVNKYVPERIRKKK